MAELKAIRVGRAVCGDLEAARQVEWLETNGLGGFASSTIVGWNTRRYHGLLVAATKPPVGRMVLLSKLEETLVVGGRRYELGTNRYPGTVHPEGYRYLREFRLEPFPVFVFEVGGIVLEKRVFLVHGENTTVVEYRVSGEAELELRPLIAFRDFHATTHRNDALNAQFEARDGMAILRPYDGLPELYLAHEASVEAGDGWYFHFQYDAERERGLDFDEDLFNPLVLRYRLAADGEAAVIASTVPHRAAEAAAMRAREIGRRAAIVAAAPGTTPFIRRLTAAADAFIVQRGELKTVIAGYHWFSDWGRDTMIALPGLTLVTRRFDVARNILLAFAESLDEGMLPNRFPDSGEAPEYNTVDATLWFFEAARAYGEYSGDDRFLRESLFPRLKEIVAWHVRGTRYGIHVDGDGLLASGAPGLQLTWMDARVGDHVITPRRGKPVEIQALWYNALRILQGMAARFDDTASAALYGGMADGARTSFAAQFWNGAEGCLYDVVDGEIRDGSIRPNQIFAVSLRHPILEDDTRARGVLEVVERELLTPLGLRTLSPRDPGYRGRCEGDAAARDAAYHQGTVWPWLMGAFVDAYRRVKGDDSRVGEWLRAFAARLETAGLGEISEIADGDAPHQPRGCVAQAWSVAELLRIATRQ